MGQNSYLFLLYSTPILKKSLESYVALTSFAVYTIYQISEDGQKPHHHRINHTPMYFNGLF
jgi:hypothetical protein